MANTKISALTSATTPLAGTEVLPIVQGSATKQVSVSDLTAGRDVNTAALTATGLITASKGSTRGITIGDVTTNSGSALRMQGTSAGYNWQIDNNLNSSGIAFVQSTATGGTTYTTPKFEMLNTGNFNIAAGNAVFSTAAKGVNFTANIPAAGMTSQLLNWYEEGTWIPNQGGGLTVIGAFSSTGKYIRFGSEVRVSGTVTGATSVALAAAGIITTNLPFTVGTAGHGNVTNAALTSFAAVICTSTNITSAGAIAATGTLTFSATYFV